MKHCVVCSSTNVRRSGSHSCEMSEHPFRSPYRCLDCEARFWVVSRRARLGAAAGGALALVLVLAVAVPTVGRLAGSRAGSAANAPASGDAIEPTGQRVVDDILRSQSDYLNRSTQALPPIQSTSR